MIFCHFRQGKEEEEVWVVVVDVMIGLVDNELQKNKCYLQADYYVFLARSHCQWLSFSHLFLTFPMFQVLHQCSSTFDLFVSRVVCIHSFFFIIITLLLLWYFALREDPLSENTLCNTYGDVVPVARYIRSVINIIFFIFRSRNNVHNPLKLNNITWM